MKNFLVMCEPEFKIIGKELILLSDCLYIHKDNYSFTVPKGFITDLATLLPLGRYNRAALLHDYLYATHIVAKGVADKLFLDAMCDLEVNVFKRHMLYTGVVLFGFTQW